MLSTVFAGVLALFSSISVSYGENAQADTTTITAKQVMDHLKKQTGKNFFYSNTSINTSKQVTIDLKNSSVDEILNALSEQLEVDVEVKDKIIVLTPAKQKAEKEPVAKPEKTEQQQKRTISGKVMDENGEGIISATITYRVNGLLQGTTTQIDGSFELTIPTEVKAININMIGYNESVLNLDEKSHYEIKLSISVQGIGEVVATGFQNVDRREFTGSVQKVKMEDVQQPGLETVDKMLQGQVAGVQIENVSGTTGSRSKIRIRGNSSISGNREPLWVIDGVVMEDAVKINPNELYSGDPSTLVSSAIGGLNPNDIEEISILKDASATALYGTQAVNGVIVITTKKGKKDHFSIDYAGNFTTELKPDINDFYMMNSNERILLSEEMYNKGLINYNNLDYYAGGFGQALMRYYDKSITDEEFQKEIYRLRKENTDWFDLLFKNSFKMEHNLSVTSGSERAQYYFSLNYFKDLGNTIGQNTDRYIANFTANYNVAKNFKAGVKLNVSNKEQSIFNSSANPYVYALSTSRAIPEKEADGSDYYYTYNKTDMNIFNEIENSFSNLSNIDALFQFDLNWKIHPNINLNSIISYRKTYAHVERIYTEDSNVANAYRDNSNYYFIDPDDDSAPEEGVSILPRGGLMQTNDDRSSFFTNRNTISWSKIFGKHKVDLFGGQEYRSKIYDYGYTFGYGYEYYRGKTANPSYLPIKRAEVYSLDAYYGLNTSPTYTFSYFATATYTFKGKYTLNGNMRSDGSNQFGESARYRFLPIWSLGANWNITQEGFMENQQLFSNLALRGSYGLRGNVSGSFSPQVLAYYGLSYAINSEDKEEVLYVTQPPNPNLQWEKEHIYNLAVDFSIKNNINGSIEYYNRSNYDLISPYPVSRVTGFDQVNLNWASMRNQGFEVALNTTNMKTNKFTWSTNFTFGYNRNKVLEAFYTPTLQTLTSSNIVAPVVGNPMTGVYAFRFAGLDEAGIPTFYDADDNVVYGLDLSTRDIDALEYMGSREPLYSGGLTNSFTFKDFNFSFLFVYSGGNVTRLDDVYQYYYQDTENVSKEIVNRWQFPGDENYTNVPAILDLATQYDLQIQGYDVPYMYNNSNIRVVDASYLKLRNMVFGYNLRKAVHKINGVGDILLQIQGQNLWSLTNKDLNGRDPEALVQGSNIPLQTSYTFSIKANF